MPPGRYSNPRMDANYYTLSPQGSVGPARKRRMHDIYSTLGPQCGSGSRKRRMYAIYNILGPGGNIGGHDCMLFTARWAPREVSEATIVCYLRHVGLPGRYRKPRLYAIYDTLGSQGCIGGHDCMLFTTLWAPREVSDHMNGQATAPGLGLYS